VARGGVFGRQTSLGLSLSNRRSKVYIVRWNMELQILVINFFGEVYQAYRGTYMEKASGFRLGYENLISILSLSFSGQFFRISPGRKNMLISI